MYLRRCSWQKDGKRHAYWALVESYRTVRGARQRVVSYAADFKTLTGSQLGIKRTRRAEGAGELEVYFDPATPMAAKIVFSKYVHEHLLQKAPGVTRLRHFVCPVLWDQRPESDDRNGSVQRMARKSGA